MQVEATGRGDPSGTAPPPAQAPAPIEAPPPPLLDTHLHEFLGRDVGLDRLVCDEVVVDAVLLPRPRRARRVRDAEAELLGELWGGAGGARGGVVRSRRGMQIEVSAGKRGREAGRRTLLQLLDERALPDARRAADDDRAGKPGRGEAAHRGRVRRGERGHVLAERKARLNREAPTMPQPRKRAEA